MMKTFLQIFKAMSIVLVLSTFSCEDKINVPAGAFEPQPRIISGDWKIIKVTRNGNNLSEWVDYSQFQLTFEGGENGTGTYQINNKMPFVVSQNGNWKFDNPAYPSVITFTESGGSTVGATEVFTAITSSKSRLSLRFSPGCSGNTYEYILEKTN